MRLHQHVAGGVPRPAIRHKVPEIDELPEIATSRTDVLTCHLGALEPSDATDILDVAHDELLPSRELRALFGPCPSVPRAPAVAETLEHSRGHPVAECSSQSRTWQ